MSMSPTALDPRVNPFRPDLAASALRGRVEAARFVSGRVFRVIRSSVPLRRNPDESLGFETELLFGEEFTIYETRGRWVWGQAARDGYVGYAPRAAFAREDGADPPTHRIAALRAFLYPGPTIKIAPLGFLPHGAQVRITAMEGRFARIAEGWFFAEAAVPLDVVVADPVAEAERFLGTPYLWGGKTSLGLDCSGLVQSACFAAGIPAPRDSDMQEAALGAPMPLPADPAAFRRGDLLFWPGHVAFCQGGGRMIHATAFAMAVISEEIAPALARIARDGAPLRSARRLPQS
ncbi:MAG: C40 family peptidase [Rhabdaerophilum calidifontis]